MQVCQQDVIRGAVLVCLQGVLGEASPVAVELAKAMGPEQLDGVLDASQPTLDGSPFGRPVTVALDRAYLAKVRERLAQVPV